ncbi:GMC family oxidoreductase [Mucilaginibacter terrenus]|uniref:GMC family oxidoreductase n=1 Tax=Mucilaginibacter terrenus TaxID=2482727 RepID=A0A3E2NWJ7_9SPHI|nr:GMC family oxidoreductase [Mucilaginibacter terrenus]RFZ85385.1 GMC family oxidoreductase [Mucilaginibacter terrenus]
MSVNTTPGDTASLTFDAIVIGSGISGGWAAKELCEQGLKTLVLERGRNVEHIKDYPTAATPPWEFRYRGSINRAQQEENPLITKAAGYGDDCDHFFVKDADHPYVQEKPFDWIRGYQVGGKSLTWGRATQRWSEFEFTAPERFGYGIGWPIGYKDVAPWYSHVEKFIGICGNKDGLEAMPDGEFMTPFEMNAPLKHIRESLKQNYTDRHLVHARWAHLTEPGEVHLQQGRGKCQARNMCMRGCPFGGYFSSVSSTLPWAKKTGNLTIRPHSVVHSIIYDEQLGKASGVRVIDAETKQVIEYKARIIFLNASALNSNLVLLNSKSKRFPNGLGNDNGLMGKYIAFHNYRASVTADLDGYLDSYYYGRNPTDLILVNFRNLHKQETDFKGGYTTFMNAYRDQHSEKTTEQIGAKYKDELCEPGSWHVFAYLQGETVPKESNHVRLSDDKKDQWGIPLLVTSVAYDDNDDRMIADFHTQTSQMLEKAGCKNIQTHNTKQAPGLDIHEMGGVRMGKDPKTSLLNEWNQLHLCKNVFVTDGACMASTGNQSPSILYMALTARAATYAVNQMKEGKL